MDLLYEMTTSGTSFNRLAYSISGYNGPTLILIKHKIKDKEFVLGAFK